MSNEWSAKIEHGEHVFVESEDFTHDTRLYVNGDFADSAEALEYAYKIAKKLNEDINRIISQRECYQRGFAAGVNETLILPILKDHQIAQLVNSLTEAAEKYEGTQQLREQISKLVTAAVEPEHKKEKPQHD